LPPKNLEMYGVVGGGETTDEIYELSCCPRARYLRTEETIDMTRDIFWQISGLHE
jgi:hypothetical protein